MPSPPIVTEPAPTERRSLFGNYGAAPPSAPPKAASPDREGTPVRRDPLAVVSARCFLAQFLARAFEYPSPATWTWLVADGTRSALRAAAALVDGTARGTVGSAAEAVAAAGSTPDFPRFHDDYIAAVSHAARGSCPINEIEYGDLKADPLLQPHRLADLAAFYRAFGLELADDGGERQDHLSVELEFLAVLAGQESHALSSRLPDADLRVNLEAQRIFLREHLGRWSPTFARRLESTVPGGALAAFAGLLLAFVTTECARAGVPAGGGDVSLRPADTEAALCEGCGIGHGLPGSPAPAATE